MKIATDRAVANEWRAIYDRTETNEENAFLPACQFGILFSSFLHILDLFVNARRTIRRPDFFLFLHLVLFVFYKYEHFGHEILYALVFQQKEKQKTYSEQ